MRIIDTFNVVVNTFYSNKFTIEIWRKYISNISPTLREKLENNAKSYDFTFEILPVVNSAICNCKLLEELHNSFLKVTENLNFKVKESLGKDLDADIILYLGLCNGAGWATDLDGKSTVLLGIEKIIELNWYDESSLLNLIYHELGHIWHKTIGNLYYQTSRQSEISLWQLYQEGIAMYCEQLLCGDINYYHQDKNNWLKWCKDNKASIKHEYFRRIKNSESTQDFFGDWCSYLNYSDVGYFLGCEFVKFMLKNYSLNQVANLDINQLFMEFNKFVECEHCL